MKLWYFTANPLQQSRCGEIGSPVRESMYALNKSHDKKKYKNHTFNE